MFERLKSPRSDTTTVPPREQLRAACGALCGILVAGLASLWLTQRTGGGLWLAAPMGASAALMFAVPSSPMAQPWAVIGGNGVAALVGVGAAAFIPNAPLAAATAVGGAIGLMFLLRCLHPPGAATALLAVLTHTVDLSYALLPILVNCLLLVLTASAYNSLTGHPYPHRRAPAPPPGPGPRFTAADLDAALARYGEVLDVGRDDLEGLLQEARAQAYQRTLGELKVRDMMSRDLVTARPDTPLAQAWERLQHRSIKALPVIDAQGHVVGILTLADFLRAMKGARQVTPEGGEPPTGEVGAVALRRLTPATDGAATGQAGGATTGRDTAQAGESPVGETGKVAPRHVTPEKGAPLIGTVGEVMTQQVSVARASMHVVELLPLMSVGRHHHLPVVDEEGVLVGMLTQSDLVRALHAAVG